MKNKPKLILVIFFIIISAIIVLINPDNIFDPHRARKLSFSNTKLEILPQVFLNKKIWEQDETIVFIHAPKTAGTNVVNIVNAISNIDKNLIARRAPVLNIKSVSPNLFIQGSMGGINYITKNLDDFNGIKGTLGFISGHMPVPEILQESEFFGKQKISYISLVRDPIQRELSSANFDFQRGYVNKNEIRNYLLNSSIDNLQTRLLAGIDAMIGDCSEQTLAKAKHNIINRFKFVAISEDVEIVMSIIAEHFGIKNIAYARAQITGMKAINLEDKNLYEALKKKHKYDIELYNWVKEQWSYWKKQNIEYISSNILSDNSYLTLMPDFYKTERPEIMTSQQINEYNKQLSDKKLIPIISKF